MSTPEEVDAFFSDMDTVRTRPVVPIWKERRIGKEVAGIIVASAGREIEVEAITKHGLFIDSDPPRAWYSVPGELEGLSISRDILGCLDRMGWRGKPVRSREQIMLRYDMKPVSTGKNLLPHQGQHPLVSGSALRVRVLDQAHPIPVPVGQIVPDAPEALMPRAGEGVDQVKNK